MPVYCRHTLSHINYFGVEWGQLKRFVMSQLMYLKKGVVCDVTIDISEVIFI